MSYEEYVKKALDELEQKENWTSDTRQIRGCGYAILALAEAIHSLQGSAKK